MSYAKTKTTAEADKNQQIRMILQKRESMAQGILFNLCQGVDSTWSKDEVKALAPLSVEMAEEFIKALYKTEE